MGTKNLEQNVGWKISGTTDIYAYGHVILVSCTCAHTRALDVKKNVATVNNAIGA